MSYVYLPEQVEDFLDQDCLDGDLSATSKTTYTASKSSKPVSETDTSTTRPSGTTLEHSTGIPGLDAWILLLPAFHASRFHLQDNEKQIKTSAICGQIPSELLAKYDQDLHFWKTSQRCFLSLMDISDKYLETWPRWGMTLAGDAYELWMQAHRMRETGYGLKRNHKETFATPCASDSRGMKHKPTPQYPDLRHTVAGGLLNPEWTEWLMGWPTGWTDLKPLAMDRFQEWLDLHGNC